jgi:DNA excision repair protein ERCC-4
MALVVPPVGNGGGPGMFPSLPARRTLGKLADTQVTVIADTREQQPLPITRLPVVRSCLATGDYSFLGGETVFAVERKVATGDLISSLTGERERFERELLRLRGFRFARLLVVGSRADVEAGKYPSNANPKAILGSLAAYEVRYGLPVVWAATPEAAAALVEQWCWYFAREAVLAANAMLPRLPVSTS